MFGYFHHRQVVRTGVKNWKGHMHVWFGRFLIAISLINGGFGLKLANITSSGKIAYAVLAAIIAVSYGLILVRYYTQKGKKPEPATNNIEMS
jgi:hypothetical protein